MTFLMSLIDIFGINTPICTIDIKEFFKNDKLINQKVDYLVKKGELKRVERGIVYIPKYAKFGEVGLNTYDIINAKYLRNGNEGYIAGYKLKNLLGFSTQVPKMIEIVTNNASAPKREIKVDNQEILLRKSPIKITKENVDVLIFLELLKELELEEIVKNYENKEKIIKFIKERNIMLQDVFKYAKFYKNSNLEILSIKEVLNAFTTK